jgi:hypothetical protein
MILESKVMTETDNVMHRMDEFARKGRSAGATTCAMSGCTNKTSGRFLTCVDCRRRRLLAQIAELIPEDVEA